MENKKNNLPQLSICGGRDHSLPATPEAVALLRMLLSQPTTDLQAITQAIESDLALTIQIFQLAAQQPGTVPPGVSDISEIVVHLGRKKLQAMIARNMTVPESRAVSLLIS